MSVADHLGISPDDVELIQGETDLGEHGSGTMASKSTQLGGSAIYDAAGIVVSEARRLAADLLEAGVDDVVLDADPRQDITHTTKIHMVIAGGEIWQ